MSPLTEPDKQPDRIAGMFDAIAPRYDLLNRVLSAGIDRRWRAKAIAGLHLAATDVLVDVCTGTADIALEARRAARVTRVIGVDFAGAMLARGREKVRRARQSAHITLVRGDATRLPVRSGTADAVAVAFGIRNVQRPVEACQEMARSLRPGGRLAILEFGVPRVPGIATMYAWYFKYLLPLIGRRVSGHGGAYAYLPASVATFPAPDEFCRLLERAGFRDVRATPLTFGIAYLYTGIRR